jgi:hypothetical protein
MCSCRPTGGRWRVTGGWRVVQVVRLRDLCPASAAVKEAAWELAASTSGTGGRAGRLTTTTGASASPSPAAAGGARRVVNSSSSHSLAGAADTSSTAVPRTR